MKVVYDINQIPELDSPIALAMGVYDGVHIGHQSIIKRLHKFTRKGGTRAILTFSNHPTQVLAPNAAIPLICSLPHRLRLFQEYGIHLAIALPFTGALATQTYEEFIQNLYKKLPFSTLSLGEKTTFGKGRRGDEPHVRQLSEKMGFEVEYLKKEKSHREVVSSGRIRKAVEEGNLKKAKKLLGRPYSIQVPFKKDEVVHQNDTFYQWSYSCSGLCLLPSAVYAVHMEGEEMIPAVAHVDSQIGITGETELNLSLYFEKIPTTSELNLAFVERMHGSLSPHLRSPSFLLQKLLPEPTLS